MKRYKVFFISPALLAIIPQIINAKPPVITTDSLQISSEKVGPLKKFCDDISVRFDIHPSKSNIYTYEYFSLSYSISYNYVVIKEKTFTDACVSQYNTHYYFDVEIPTSQHLDERGINISINVGNSSKFVGTTKSFFIYPESHREINPLQNSLVTENISVYLNNNTITYDKEMFSFINFVDYFTNDLYYRLNLNQFKFQYSAKSNFTYEKAYIKFIDTPEILRGFENKQINLNLNNNNGYIEPSLSQILYVNTKTLEMSFEFKKGYVSTRYFYFPINHKNDLYNTTLDFNFIGCGVNKINIHFSVYFYGMTDLVGSCSQSEYCVVGDVR